MYIYTYIYVYIYRERERLFAEELTPDGTLRKLSVLAPGVERPEGEDLRCKYIYIYIYIYITLILFRLLLVLLLFHLLLVLLYNINGDWTTISPTILSERPLSCLNDMLPEG